MKTLSFAEARAKLSLFVDRVATMEEEVRVIRNGRPAALLVSPDEYAGWKETRAIRSDRELMTEIRRGLRGLRMKRRIDTLEELIADE
jgi:prevent-host-death family protein